MENEAKKKRERERMERRLRRMGDESRRGRNGKVTAWDVQHYSARSQARRGPSDDSGRYDSFHPSPRPVTRPFIFGARLCSWQRRRSFRKPPRRSGSGRVVRHSSVTERFHLVTDDRPRLCHIARAYPALGVPFALPIAPAPPLAGVCGRDPSTAATPLAIDALGVG